MKVGPHDKGVLDELISRYPRYDPHPANEVDNFTWNDLLAQLMLLTDSGFYSHLSQLVNSPEKYQYFQLLFTLDLLGGVDHTAYLQAFSKLLALPNLVSNVDIDEFIFVLGDKLYYRHHPNFPIALNDFQRSPPYLNILGVYFEGFQRDPARSGGFHHDPAMWHAFAATRFLATASSQ